MKSVLSGEPRKWSRTREAKVSGPSSYPTLTKALRRRRQGRALGQRVGRVNPRPVSPPPEPPGLSDSLSRPGLGLTDRLRTNLNDRTPEDLWHTYIQLTDAEAAFRTFKTDLVLRPIYHQVQARVHAHILVAFLAYAMRKTLQKWMEQAGLGRGVRTVMEELARIKCCHVILPTSTGQEIELRCITQPDGYQRTLLQRLGLRLPARLGRPTWRKMVDTLSRM